jgi:hypothetical protein
MARCNPGSAWLLSRIRQPVSGNARFNAATKAARSPPAGSSTRHS